LFFELWSNFLLFLPLAPYDSRKMQDWEVSIFHFG